MNFKISRYEIGINVLYIFFYSFLCTKCFYAWNRCATLLSPRHTIFMVMNVTQDIGTKSSGSDRNPSGCSLSHCSRTCLLDWWIFMRLIRWSSPLSPRVVKRGVTSKKRGKLRVEKGHSWWRLEKMQTRISLLEHRLCQLLYNVLNVFLSRCIIVVSHKGEVRQPDLWIF